MGFSICSIPCIPLNFLPLESFISNCNVSPMLALCHLHILCDGLTEPLIRFRLTLVEITDYSSGNIYYIPLLTGNISIVSRQVIFCIYISRVHNLRSPGLEKSRTLNV